MRVRVSVRQNLSMRLCVCYYLFHHFVIYQLSDTFNFTCPPSHGSVSIGAVFSFRHEINHHWLMFSPLTSIHALLTRHAQSTSKSSSLTLFRSRPFQFLLFCLVSLHQSLNGTLADPGHWLKSFPLPGSVVFSAFYPSPVCKSYGFLHHICSASVWCLLCVKMKYICLQMN